MAAKIISVASAKGGTGKTTFTIILAACLAAENKKVLVIDSDQQRSAYNLYQRQNDESALFEVESLEARFLFDYLKINRNNYDIIFLDVPRLTDKDESAAVQILTLCDHLLIPVLSGQFDIVSTINFYNEVIQPIAAFKKANKIPFSVYGFLNKRNQIKDNEKVIPFMKKAGIKMFTSSLSDLKVFRDISVNESILSTSKGSSRFADFYKEFKKKIKV